jgi:hypothetical protein
MMNAIRTFLSLAPKSKPAPSSNIDARGAAPLFDVQPANIAKATPSSSMDKQREFARLMINTPNTDIAGDRISFNVYHSESVASWLSGNDDHQLLEPGFYGSDKYMEFFNDNWVLDDMMFLTFFYPVVPDNKAQQPRDLTTAILFEYADGYSGDDNANGDEFGSSGM